MNASPLSKRDCLPSRDKVNHHDSDARPGASPRCVMQQQQDSMPSSSTSPLSHIAKLERYNYHTVRKAKLCMIRSQYKAALAVSNDYLKEQLQDGWNGPLSYFQTTVKLTTPLIFLEDLYSNLQEEQTTSHFFQVRLGTQLTAVDEMATIVLQSWYEIAKHNNLHSERQAWQHLLPVLQIYSLHPMPVQLFVQIWVPFWHSFPSIKMLNGQKLALTWSLQVAVMLVEQSIRIDATPALQPVLLEELREELVEFLFFQQLPRLSSPVLVRSMATAVLAPRRESCESLFPKTDQVSFADSNQLSSLRVLRTVLESSQDSEDWPEISNEWRSRLLQHKILQDIPPESDRKLPSLLLPHQSLSAPYGFRLPGNVDVYLRKLESKLPPSIQSFIRRLQSHVSSLLGETSPKTTSDQCTEMRQVQQWQKIKIAMSILSMLIAWRHAGMLRRMSKTVAMAFLAPFTELVDALSSTNGKKKK